jgi:hypothetical protein
MSTRPIPRTTITISSTDLWNFVKNLHNANKLQMYILDQLNLISHFAYFTFLNTTIRQLEQMIEKTKQEKEYMFNELKTLTFIQCTSPFLQ